MERYQLRARSLSAVCQYRHRGNYFYDAFGNFLNQGWLIYNVSQSNPEEFGTVLFEAQRFRNWFSEVAVASEQKGQYAYALTISSDLRTTLTPMVLSKPRLDGIQFDFAMDKYRGTFLYAQASAPRGITNQELRRTNSTTLIGGRFEVQIGDFVELGVHTANAHQANSLSEEALLSNWVTGSLTQGQNRTHLPPRNRAARRLARRRRGRRSVFSGRLGHLHHLSGWPRRFGPRDPL